MYGPAIDNDEGMHWNSRPASAHRPRRCRHRADDQQAPDEPMALDDLVGCDLSEAAIRPSRAIGTPNGTRR
jgi:hypothetical protein